MKEQIAKQMLAKVMESIEEGKVSAIHLALKLHSKGPEEHSEEPYEEKEHSVNKEQNKVVYLGACPKCAKNRDKCKCA